MPRKVTLWGGRHDGETLNIDFTYDEFCCLECRARYAPRSDGDYLMNLWRYHPFTSEQSGGTP